MEQLQLFGDLFYESIVQGRKLLQQSSILEIRNIGELAIDALIPLVPRGLYILFISLVNFILVLGLTYLLAMIFIMMWDASLPNQTLSQHPKPAIQLQINDGAPSLSETAMSSIKRFSNSLISSFPKLTIVTSSFGAAGETAPTGALLRNADAADGFIEPNLHYVPDEIAPTGALLRNADAADGFIEPSIHYVPDEMAPNEALLRNYDAADAVYEPSPDNIIEPNRNVVIGQSSDMMLQVSQHDFKQILDEFEQIDQIRVEEVHIPDELLHEIGTDDVILSYNSRASTTALKSMRMDSGVIHSDPEKEDDAYSS